MKQYEPDGLMVVSLTGPLRPRESGFRYAFLPDPALREMGPPAHARLSEGGTLTRFTTASLRTISDTNKFYLQMNTPDGNKEFQRLPIWPAEDRNGRFREITGLVLKKAFAQDLTVLIGSMTSPMAAMDKCLDDLITGWGLDAKIEKNLSRRVAMKTFSSPDPTWPKIQSFLTVLKSSHFRVRFMVEGDGTMTSCQVLGAAKGTPEAAALCKAYQDNARFEGALDSNGTPVPSYFMTDMSILGVAL
ncbi:hypothetical protein [Sphingomonas sp. Leaf67]|uniref:hypothetical protein n=1 Tax=Sphingomonas sp. Leaf67 TaxID=1736230 RepID=UPI0012E1CCDE|nr:hypothetical protein [Sphingomonas sp. Leaf67]